MKMTNSTLLFKTKKEEKTREEASEVDVKVAVAEVVMEILSIITTQKMKMMTKNIQKEKKEKEQNIEKVLRVIAPTRTQISLKITRRITKKKLRKPYPSLRSQIL
jgi:hypothetical protein